MPKTLITLILTTSLLAGCGDFPDLNDSVSRTARNSPYPDIINLDGMLTDAFAGQDAALAASDSLAARAARLRARAAKLRRTVIDPRTKRRMKAALRRHPT